MVNFLAGCIVVITGYVLLTLLFAWYGKGGDDERTYWWH